MYNNDLFSNCRVKKKTKKSKQIIMENILKEYQLKRNNFNPTIKSPNHFALRLKYRMRTYYNSLLNC